MDFDYLFINPYAPELDYTFYLIPMQKLINMGLVIDTGTNPHTNPTALHPRLNIRDYTAYKYNLMTVQEITYFNEAFATILRANGSDFIIANSPDIINYGG